MRRRKPVRQGSPGAAWYAGFPPEGRRLPGKLRVPCGRGRRATRATALGHPLTSPAPFRPRPHRPALRRGGGPETPSAVPAQAETSPAPSQLRQGGSEASLLCPHPARGWSSPGPLPPALGCVVACPTQPHVADAGCLQHRSPILGPVLGQPFPTVCDPVWSESTWSLRLAPGSCPTHHGSGCGSAPCQHSTVRGAHALGIVY